jgi:hypothetical protein
VGIVVRIDGPAAAVRDALLGLAGVHGVEALHDDAAAGSRFRVAVVDPAPVQRVLAAAVVQRGWTLLEMQADAPTLEELFVRVIG